MIVDSGSSAHVSDRPHGKSRLRRLLRWALWLLAGALLLAVVLALARLLLHVPASSLVSLQAFTRRLKYVGILMQLLAALLAAWRWTSLVDWAIGRGHIRARDRASALAARSWAVLLMLALLLIEAGPFDLLRLLTTR